MIKRRILACIVFLALISSVSLIFYTKSFAASASNWKAGNIINDAMFTNANSMNVSQIQAFLNSKVGTGAYGTTGQCDTYGAKTSELGGGTRAQYGSAHNNPAPFTCLKDYYEVPKTTPASNLPANNYGGKSIPAGAKSAAQIIWDAAQKYNISPQVLLVKLGTESAGPLTSDDWPFLNQYTYAMGSHCPDSGVNGSANCDVNYSGFSMQMDSAASLLRWYLDSMEQSWWTYKKPYQVNSILWNIKESGCLGGDVYIENKATAALYTYTPYQPNQAALNNMYGTGDRCSAYGNRNFWRTFSDWFGSTQALNGNIQISKSLTVSSLSDATVYQGETVSASYEVSNTANYDTLVGGLGVCARINGEYYDFGFDGYVVVPANGKRVISYSKKIDQTGSLTMMVCSYHYSLGGWVGGFYPYDTSGTFVRSVTKQVKANPLITTNATFSPNDPIAGQPLTASITITNSSPVDVNIGALVFAARDKNGTNYDFPADLNIIVPANGTITYSKTRSFDSAGIYSYFLANLKDNQWSMTYPASNSGLVRNGTFEIKDNPLITSGLTISPQNPAIGQLTTASFEIENKSSSPINIGTMLVAARDRYGNNVDFPADENVIVPANGKYTYLKQKTFVNTGLNHSFIANFKNNKWDWNYPKSSNANIVRQCDYSLKDNPLVATGITISPSSPVAGQSVTATVTIRNDSSSAVNIGAFLVAGRDPNGNNVDFPADLDITIPATTTYTYSKTKIFNLSGSYSLFMASFKNNTWDWNYPKSLNDSVIRKTTIKLGENPVITSGLTFSPSTLLTNQNVTVSVSLKNNSDTTVNIGTLVIAGRDPNGNNVDFPADLDITIPSGSTLVYSKTRQFSIPGKYSFFIADFKNGIWSWNYPASFDASIIRSVSKTVY